MGHHRSLWCNWLARLAVNRKVGGASPPRDMVFALGKSLFCGILSLKMKEVYLTTILFCADPLWEDHPRFSEELFKAYVGKQEKPVLFSASLFIPCVLLLI